MPVNTRNLHSLIPPTPAPSVAHSDATAPRARARSALSRGVELRDIFEAFFLHRPEDGRFTEDGLASMAADQEYARRRKKCYTPTQLKKIPR